MGTARDMAFLSLTVATLVGGWCWGASAFKVDSFLSPSPLFHVAVNGDKGQVYVGGRNALLQLSPNLTLSMRLSVGPVKDGAQCNPLHDEGEECPGASLAPNDVRVVEVDVKKQKLLVCGSARQGLCRLHSLSNISNYVQVAGDLHSNFVAGKKSVAVLFDTNYGYDYLFVGQEYDGRDMSLSPNVMSIRSVETAAKGYEINFTVYDQVTQMISAMDVHPDIKSNFSMEFVEILQDSSHVYFLTQQNKFVNSGTLYPRLGRICFTSAEAGGEPDWFFKSYTELGLLCRKGEQVYPRVLAAVIEDEVLYFSAASGWGSSGDTDSVLCAVELDDLSSMFVQVNYDCYNMDQNSDAQLLAWKKGQDNRPCTRANVEINEKFCGLETNWGVQSTPKLDDGLSSDIQALEEFEGELVTGLASTRQNQRTVLILATSAGRILKVEAKAEKSRVYFFHKVADDPIRQDMSFDADETHLYFTAGKSVYRFPISTCSVHRECGVCLKSLDPLGCGWCQTSCTTKAECSSNMWTDPKDKSTTPSCPPSIYSISPLFGPRAGGTRLTLTGANFGLDSLHAAVNVSVGRASCRVVSNSSSQLQCIVGESRGVSSANISVFISNQRHTDDRPYYIYGTDTSDDVFTFAEPSMSSYHPLKGPSSGGTNITIEGSHLDVGSHASVILGNKVQCVIFRRLAEEIGCTVGASQGLKDAPVKVSIDNAVMTAAGFQFVPDPVITMVTPHRAFVSGGITITVSGSNLDAALQPTLRALYKNTDTGSSSVCQASQNGTLLKCPALDLKETLKSMKNPPETVDLVLRLDGVTPQHEHLRHFQYFHDPNFFPFSETGKLKQYDLASNEGIKIAGEHLQSGFGAKDMVVKIEGLPCNVTKKEENLVICQPQYHEAFIDDNQGHEVQIQVGHLYFNSSRVGYVKFTRTAAAGISPVIIALIVIVILVVIGVVVLFIVMKRQKVGIFKPKGEEPSIAYTAGTHEGVAPNGSLTYNMEAVENDYFERNGILGASGETQPLLPIDDDILLLMEKESLLIDKECLTQGQEIGKGNFGCVKRGFLTLPEQKGDILVAIKTLHDNNPRPIELKSFLQEALMMKDFHHPNVLTLIGVCLNLDAMPLVVLPFMTHGDLLTYIRDEHNQPTIRDLIMFGVDIARGMDYLASLKFVHRDLAARNCMLDDEFHVKVADFGLARDIYAQEYYSSENKKAKLPVKWMALESLEKGNYSSKTDVWSFGVVLWELLTRGVTPYPDVDNWDIIRYLKAGRRMPQPNYCPNMLYTIMLQCWSADSASRPTFHQLEQEIIGMVEELEHSTGNQRRNIQSTYVHVDQCSNYHYNNEIELMRSRAEATSEPTSEL